MFRKNQQEQAAAQPAAAWQPPQPSAEIQAALREIGVFAGQMEQMTKLFATSQAEMARQIEETTERLDKAVASVSAGEARISAQIAQFEGMTNAARRSAEEHERVTRDMIEQFRRVATELANESMRPLKAEVDSVSRHMADANARIVAASSGFSHAMETAVGVVSGNTEKLLHQQAELLAVQVGEAMKTGHAKLCEVTEALNHAGGALAHRIWVTAEAQDTKLKAFEALTKQLEAISVVIPSPDAMAERLAQSEAAAERMDEASKAVGAASSKIVDAVVELQSVNAADTSAGTEQAAKVQEIAARQEYLIRTLEGLTERLDEAVVRTASERSEAVTAMLQQMDELKQGLSEVSVRMSDGENAGHDIAAGMTSLASRQTDIAQTMTGLTQMLDSAIMQTAAERSEAVDELLERMDGVREALTNLATAKAAEQDEQAQHAASVLPAIEVEREAMKRLTIGYRMMMKDIGKENERLEGLIGALEGSIRTLDEKAEALSAPPVVMPLAATAAHSADRLPLLHDEKDSLQRLLTGFRLLLRDINEESERLRSATDAVAAKAADWPVLHAKEIAPADNVELAALSAAIAGLDGKIDMLRVEAMPAPAEAIKQSTSGLPVFDSGKDSLQRVLAGFKLLLRDIAAETEAYREKVTSIRQPEILVLAPKLEAELLAPLQGVAERIAEGVAESLVSLEQNLSRPMALLTDAVADNARLLTSAHAAMAEPAGRAPVVAPWAATSLDSAVAAMERAAQAIDGRISQVDQLLSTLRKGGAASTESLRDLVARMESAAGDLRQEAGDFLAIGAALSRDLEVAAAAGADETPSRRQRSAPNAKKRSA